MIAAAMSSSPAFMLPVAAPPSAIVFGTGCDDTRMAGAGVWMNGGGASLIPYFIAIFGTPLLGVIRLG